MVAGWLAILGGDFRAADVIPDHSTSAPSQKVVLPKGVPDPIEPVNRFVWGINKASMKGVIKPTARIYRFIVRKPVRTAINNFNRNITYPGRMINNLLNR